SRSDKKDQYYIYATFAERGYEFEEIIGMEGEPDQPISVRWRIWDGDETTWGSLPTDDPEYKVFPVNPYAQQQIARLHEIKIYSGLPGADFVATSTNKIGEEKPFVVTKNAQSLIFSEMADVVLYSAEGTAVKQAKQATELNISQLNKGVYVVKATTNDGVVRNRKVVLN
ncbi:MAG: T9SS type A sorting domain-containing protein, partial [Bacteroidales bacterium]